MKSAILLSESETAFAMPDGPFYRPSLIQAIQDLEDDRLEPLESSALTYDLSLHLKPKIDRLVALRSGSPDALEELSADAELREIGRSERTIGDLLAERDAEESEEHETRRRTKNGLHHKVRLPSFRNCRPVNKPAGSSWTVSSLSSSTRRF